MMRPWASLLLVAGATLGTRADVPTRPAETVESGAHLELSARSVEVGEPLSVELVVGSELPDPGPGGDVLAAERRARSELRARFGEELFEAGGLDYSWLLLDEEPLVIRRVAGDGGPGMLVARRGFRLASLEAGTRSLPLPAFAGELEAPEVEFTSALAEGEDAPRPLISFRPIPPEPEESSSTPWLTAAAAAGLFAALITMLVRRRQRGGGSSRVEDPRQALEELMSVARHQGAGEAELREAHFELTRLVRAALDRAGLESTSPGTTDLEWLQGRSAELGLADELRGRLKELFDECAQVKYAGAAVTEWGLEERIETALELTQGEEGS